MNRLVDILFVIGLFLISIGFFTWNPIIGFIGTGAMFMLVSFLLFKGGE